jgi:HD-GYP domain-containing protein (c-di-GMP phosphodiesterase class II)
MSSQPPNGAPSRPPEGSPGATAALIRDRGAPLLDGLDRHLEGAREHAEAAGSYAFATAVELGGDRQRAELVREIAKLHEIGRVYVPGAQAEAQPAAPGPEESSPVGDHYEAGFRLARGAGLPERVCDWILRFRERFDGEGPEGLRGDAIPIESRIARAACVCDLALGAPGAGSGDAPGERQRHAIERLHSEAGYELDPRIVDALVAVIERTASPERGPLAEPGSGAGAGNDDRARA